MALDWLALDRLAFDQFALDRLARNWLALNRLALKWLALDQLALDLLLKAGSGRFLSVLFLDILFLFQTKVKVSKLWLSFGPVLNCLSTDPGMALDLL